MNSAITGRTGSSPRTSTCAGTPRPPGEVYPKLMAPDTQWQVYREYYCPQCGTLHDVEAPTPWYPVIHDFEPDIDTFYKEWVNLPLPERAA